MTRPPRNDGLAELARRLREYQLRVRDIGSRKQAIAGDVGTLAPLSGSQQAIVLRLRQHAPRLADSLEQAVADVADSKRRTYVGAAGEAREVMRATIQLFSSDADVREQPWYRGTQQGKQTNPSQSERLRYAVQQRGGDYRQTSETVDTIDERIGRLGRSVYQRASSAFHAENQRQEARKLINWVFAVIDEVLPE
jgi:hypothetical protein